MKIGIDARFLTHPQPGGFKTYSENLINALSRVDRVNQYVLYLDRLPAEGTLPQQSNFTYQVVDGTLPAVGMPIREQIKLRWQIDQHKRDLVHFLCNTAPVGISGKFIVTLHDTIQVTTEQNFKLIRSLPNHKRWAMTAYSKWTILKTIQAANKIITVSNYEKTQIRELLGIESQRIWVTHLAPNPVYTPAGPELREAWRMEMQQKFGLGRRFILGVGYEPRKNISLLIEAFAQLAPTQPDLDLVIVAAETGRRAFFEQLVVERNLASRVNILAAMPPCELVKLYNLAEVFVFPSERESFGLPPLEAISCGTPTVAMNKTSLPEILGKAALFVDGKDVQIWANSIQRVLSDTSLRLQLIDDGLKQASTFNWQRCAVETVQVYQDVLEGFRNKIS
jgi:glycosyltransferase involved in cell wall biosynthesis